MNYIRNSNTIFYSTHRKLLIKNIFFRSCAVGLSSTMGRVGAMVAPFAPLLGTITIELPLLCFAGAPLIAAILTGFLLPETRGHRLPDTVREAEAI